MKPFRNNDHHDQPGKWPFFVALTLGCGCRSLPSADLHAQTPKVTVAEVAQPSAVVATEPPMPLRQAGDPPPASVAEGAIGPQIPYDPAPRLLPIVVPGVAGAVRIAVSAISTCALRDEGRVICWGNFPVDPTGRISSIQPVPVWLPVWNGIRGLADGEGGVFALLRGGTVQGYFDVLHDVDHVATFHLGRKLPCMLQVDGTVVCWQEYRIGFEPRNIMLHGATQVDSKFHHACALDSRSKVVCWGDNSSGQLGDATFKDKADPTEVVNLPRSKQVTVGGDHSCALQLDGRILCWGAGGYGAIGDGSLKTQPVPMVVQGLSNAVQVAAGAHHTCALLRDGSVWCWGWNLTGQLGDGTTQDRPIPGKVVGLPPAVQIATYTSHTCTLLLGGKVACWGSNSHGQIGVRALTYPNPQPGSVQR